MRRCKTGCKRDPGHPGRCYRRGVPEGLPKDGYAQAAHAAREKRLRNAKPDPTAGTRAVVANIALRDAALNLAMVDLHYERTLCTEGATAAREVLRTLCVPARQAYRRALDRASKEDPA